MPILTSQENSAILNWNTPCMIAVLLVEYMKPWKIYVYEKLCRSYGDVILPPFNFVFTKSRNLNGR